MADEDIVTIRDIYVLVQRLNMQVTTLSQQVTTLTQRAAEDRISAEKMEREMGKLKIKVYSAVAALTLASTLVMVSLQAVSTS